jgi:hypothetical protein
MATDSRNDEGLTARAWDVDRGGLALGVLRSFIDELACVAFV